MSTQTSNTMYCIQMTRHYYGPRTVRETLEDGTGTPIPYYANGEYYRTYRIAKVRN